MKNIEYLEQFFKKHKLTGKISVNYSSRLVVDEFMTDIMFEDGVSININDIIFDIDSELPDDVLGLWLEARKENDLSLPEWIQTNIKYVPDMDRSSVEAYQKEMTDLFMEVEDKINTILKFRPEDEGDSESEDE